MDDETLATEEILNGLVAYWGCGDEACKAKAASYLETSIKEKEDAVRQECLQAIEDTTAMEQQDGIIWIDYAELLDRFHHLHGTVEPTPEDKE